MGKDPAEFAEKSAFERALRAGKLALENKPATLNLAEQAMLETFPEEDRLAVIVFVRWSEGQKWKGGIANKLAAKAAFLQAARIFRAIYGPQEADPLEAQAERFKDL